MLHCVPKALLCSKSAKDSASDLVQRSCDGGGHEDEADGRVNVQEPLGEQAENVRVDAALVHL